MHAAGIHSALAIKRQRKRLDEARRARERRHSHQSTESGLTSPRGSQMSLNRRPHRANRSANANIDSKVTSIGMLHIGVVFLVLGLFLIGSGLVPDDLTSWTNLKDTANWWNELIFTGLFAVAIGVFLIVLNKYISRKEDEDLEEYVQSQLTRSRSGHRLERDVETGGMITKHTKREKRLQKEDEERRLSGIDVETPPMSPRSPPAAPTPHGFMNPQAMSMNGDVVHDHHLGQIVEETPDDLDSRRMEYFNKGTYMGSVDPSDSRERHMVISRM